MKEILFVALLSIAVAVNTELEDRRGPAFNYKHKNSEISCSDDSFTVYGVSDCVDRLLYDEDSKRYNDRCCFIRYQKYGDMYSQCIGLSEESYLDIAITMKRLESGRRLGWPYYSTQFEDSKIYQIDCFSPYLKSISIASILLLALFF